MASTGSVQFDLADGTTVTVEEDELQRVYRELWELARLPGAISAAALLVHEAERHLSHRQTVDLNGPQTVAFRRALDTPCNPVRGDTGYTNPNVIQKCDRPRRDLRSG